MSVTVRREVGPPAEGGTGPAGTATVRQSFRASAGLALVLIAYRLIVDVGYRALVAGPFDYWGFRNAQLPGRVVLSWLILLALLPLLVRLLRSDGLAAHTAAVLAMISFVPTTTLIAHDPRYHLTYIWLMFLYWLLFLVACVFLPTIRPFRAPVRSEVPHLALALLLCLSVMYLSWVHTGFRLHFALFDVYDLRTEARGYSVPTVLGYLATIADNVLPVLLALYLGRRWLLPGATLGAVILFNYGISGTKQVLFLLVIAVASIFVRSPRWLGAKVLAMIAAVIGLALLEKLLTGTIFLGTLSVYRVFSIPAQLHWVHYDFFQTNQLLYLTQSALRFVFESPYQENVQFLLGEYYIGDFNARANNGLFTDAYMNFGGAGVLFYPVVLAVLLRLLDGAAAGLAGGVQFMLVIALSFIFLGLPLSTAFLTAGVGILIVLLPTVPRRGACAGAMAGAAA
jgi:hypothetical protein